MLLGCEPGDSLACDFRKAVDAEVDPRRIVFAQRALPW